MTLAIRTLAGVSEQKFARDLFDEVWPTDEGTQLTANLLQAMVHNGTYVAGAFMGDEIVAAAFAFPGVGDRGELRLHSHMAAVKEGYRNQNIGSALKWHQRSWAISHGYKTITWTFDPLVRRNAKVNILKLGVSVEEYFPDFYGDLPDALNAGDPTDRVIAKWELLSERVEEAKHGGLAFDPFGIGVALTNDGGVPRHHDLPSETASFLCYLPDDIITIRSVDPQRALAWRLALRKELQPRLDGGWSISGFTTDGAYVVSNQNGSR